VSSIDLDNNIVSGDKRIVEMEYELVVAEEYTDL
jgi:hypothetical protein